MGLFDAFSRILQVPLPPPLPDVETLTSTELEQTWARVKVQIVLSNAYKHEQRYVHLYDQAERLLTRILRPSVEKVFDPGDHVRAQMLQYVWPAHGPLRTIRNDLDPDALGPQLTLSLAFHCWRGMGLSSSSRLSAQLSLATGLVDRLIQQKHAPAFFLKGVMLKYGLSHAAPPKPTAAEGYLSTAKDRGVPGAADELPLLWMHQEAARAPAANAPFDLADWQ